MATSTPSRGPRTGGGDRREGGPGGQQGGKKKFFYRRKRVCKFCVEKLEYIDFKDVKLYDKLRAEKKGVLAILVWAASVWYERYSTEQGGLVLPERVIQQSKEFIERNDPVTNWLDERARRGPELTSPSQVAYESYLSWHSTSQAPGEPMSMVRWADALQKSGYVKRKTESGMRWVGFRLLGATELAEKDELDEEEQP